MKKRKQIKFCIVLGTRPEIIKMSSIIRYCMQNKLDYFIIDTAQHYEYLMSRIFLDELKIPRPKYGLEASRGTHAEQVAKMILFIERVLVKEKPDVVLIEGDTNTVLSGALAAVKLHIKIAHVEAGLRSRDERMPEETNRILADHMSNFLFAPTIWAKENLLEEGIPDKKIFVVGNTIVDAVKHYSSKIMKPICIGECFGLNSKKDSYMLTTVHRPENVDSKEVLKQIMEGLELVYKRYRLPIIWPIHPRTKRMFKKFNLSMPEGIRMINPVSYLHMLHLIKWARLVLTDSGGVQEESCILRVPCVTMRISTERPSTVHVGANIIAGTNSLNILRCAKVMLKKQRKWRNPFGNGTTGERIVRILRKKLG